MYILQVIKMLIYNFLRCNFHKKCAFAPRNNCAKSEPIVPNTFLANTGQHMLSGNNFIIRKNLFLILKYPYIISFINSNFKMNV